ERGLQVAPPLRRLPRVPPVEDERLRQVRALRDGEHARPELVVLALEVGRVVAEALLVEQVAVEQHRRMEERRREQQVPAHGGIARRHDVEGAWPALAELQYRGPENAEPRA